MVHRDLHSTAKVRVWQRRPVSKLIGAESLDLEGYRLVQRAIGDIQLDASRPADRPSPRAHSHAAIGGDKLASSKRCGGAVGISDSDLQDVIDRAQEIARDRSVI